MKKTQAIVVIVFVFILCSGAVSVGADTLPVDQGKVYESQPQETTFKNATASPWTGGTQGAPYLTGDWFGLRNKLLEKGVEITSTFVCDVLGNTTGGKVQATRYDHSLGMDIDFDLEKLLSLKGLKFHFSWLW